MSSPAFRAAFFDIDGTLIDHAAGGPGAIPPSAIASLRALRRKGVRLFVATGRPLEMVAFLEGVFPFDGFVTFNGQLVMERDGTVLHRQPHHPGDIEKLVELVRQDPFPCLIQEQEAKFYVLDFPVIQKHYAKVGLPLPTGPYDPARQGEHPVLQFLAYVPYGEAARRLAPLEHIEITSAGGEILDIIPKTGGKEVGIAAAAAHYGWSRDQVLVFGDGDNDARMLAWGPHGVALGNGSPRAKAAASYVTTPVGEDGIKNALLALGALEEGDFPPL